MSDLQPSGPGEASQPSEPRRTPLNARAPWLWLCRAAILVALGASAALLIQYLNPAAASFCGLDSGCEVVRRFGYKSLAPLAENSELVRSIVTNPLLSPPMVGLVAYATLLAVSLGFPNDPWTLRLSGIGAIVAIVLISIQLFVIHAVCWLCFVVDGSAVAAFVFASLDSRTERGPERDPLKRWAWAALAASALAIPVGWAKVKPLPKVPAVITALYEPGKINVVEFADFECPFCRMFHPILQKVIHEYAGRVHFVRQHAPLPGHPDAAPAAIADVCAEFQGQGEAVAERLVTGELSPEALRQAAKDAGVNLAEWDQCLSSPRANERVLSDIKRLETAGMLGLPTTYVEDIRVLGAVDEATLRGVFERAASGRRPFSMPAPAYIGLSLLLLAGIAWLGRDRRGTLEYEPSD